MLNPTNTGNGGVNDFSRTLAASAWNTRLPANAITMFSGGTEGVLSPHVTLIVREHSPAAPTAEVEAQSSDETRGLVAVVGRTRVFQPQEIGRASQALEVASKVRSLLQGSSIAAQEVALVLIKCPLLTSTKINAVRAMGQTPAATNAYESMGKSRYASAVGIACALSDASFEKMTESIGQAMESGVRWGEVASCSAGAELDDCHILVLANSTTVTNSMRAVSGYMHDAVDATAITALLKTAEKDEGNPIQFFAKAEPSPDSLIRGKRHTMNTDSDMSGTRHARAAVGGLIAGLTGDTAVYVSGGAEGQGPAGGGGLCLVYSKRS